MNLTSQLRKSVTLIIHTAWRVDFNLSLASFEPTIRATRHLVDFARSARYASSLRLIFTSSVAAAQSWDHSKGCCPEEIIDDASTAFGNGYGESKYAVEQVPHARLRNLQIYLYSILDFCDMWTGNDFVTS